MKEYICRKTCWSNFGIVTLDYQNGQMIYLEKKPMTYFDLLKTCDLSEWKQNFNSALVFLHGINDKFFRKIFERERETYYLCLLLLNGRGKCACRTNYKTTVR